jgi:nucleoredoxin
MKSIATLSISSLVCGLLTLGCIAETEAPASLSDILGSSFVNAKGESVEIAALEDKAVIGLYFSALWCPPCRAFTPKLVEAANQLKTEGKPFEVVFVTSDRSADAMSKYMTDYNMPWLAIPFGDAKIAALKKQFGIRGIPALIIIDGKGNLIEQNGRSPIASQGAKAFDTWAAAKE